MARNIGDSIDAWDEIAGFWDDTIGPEGNRFHRTLVGPAAERLLKLQPGERVLDIACGNGQFARRLAGMGAAVTAFDGSATFIDRARGYGVPDVGSIEYHVGDVTDTEWLLSLGEFAFDAAVCTMALMDISDIEPIAATLTRLLKPGGRFVWSVSHPCFNSTGGSKIVEEIQREGDLVLSYAIKTESYLQPTARRGIGIIGQPVPHTYYHRPISLLLNTFLAKGFVLDGFEEPAFAPGIDHNRPMSWSHFHDIPPLLVVSMRLV
ncbi:MAG: class I SAM-dependent methyltransferase [Caldilineales bacterium]|nr:class I SAM-dependent methyltransferase [Caldilineales bacterium]